MGGGALHKALKTLCLNTDWNYAVFWKLNSRTRMMLTCEDAYYDKNEKHDPSGSKWFDNMVENLPDEQYAQDLLGLTVAKMSYHGYSLGEGIVGQVAVMGKHLWVSGDQLVNDPCLSVEDYDVWKTQFAIGIRTVAVVAVVPHGVVQLGSLNTIAEDLTLVNRIREIFLELQSSLTGCMPSSTNSYGDTVTSVNFGINMSYTISDLDQNGDLCLPGFSNVQMPMNSEENIESQSEIDAMNTLKASFKFPAGCELYEALGPAFCKRNDSYDWETVDEMPGTSSSNLLTPNSGPEHLLEAVVANVCRSNSEFSNSVKWVEPPFNDKQTSDSGCYSFERSFLVKEDTPTNTETYGSSLGFSSASHSRCSEPLERSQEPAKVSKKRARPGESSRPRPRDRQLIQDRIKELRELVPNGSKCSIDSLLERTIKHMLFMQCVTKHADKIDKCAESKLIGKETGIRGSSSSHDHGSSWAMEVGNHLKVCPVTVENIGTNGQMLVEMMCEEGVHFLEIAEAIRSLGLTILKGVTEPNGDKTWMCFVVEGQNNRNVHRMDILWLLVQILQSKTKT